MVQQPEKIAVYLEIGQKRTFAGANEWPGWCRSGRDEASALHALFEYGSRYESTLSMVGLEFQPPVDETAFTVGERLGGNATTDFGAPGIVPSRDNRSMDDLALQNFQSLLMACWQTFDTFVIAAAGKPLSKGPRGGGRELETIVQHVQDSQAAYLQKIGGKLIIIDGEDPDQKLARTRREILSALGSAARGDAPTQGPRGGAYWTPRYFVRRLAWHVLDHAWEIEDRHSR